MKSIIMAVLVASSALATTMEIKKAEVVVSVNTLTTRLKVGTTLDILEGTTVCYVKGKGKVIFPQLKKQLKKRGRCLLVPLSEENSESYIADIKNKITVAFWDSSESVHHGSGTKGNKEFTNSTPIIVSKSQNELVLYGKEFGPLPVTVVLKDKKGQILEHFENDESETTLVRISRAQFQEATSLEIYNGFEEKILTKEIKLKE